MEDGDIAGMKQLTLERQGALAATTITTTCNKFDGVRISPSRSRFCSNVPLCQ